MKLILFLILLLDVPFYGRTPPWVLHLPHPQSALGMGRDEVSAESSAFAALARSFSMRVESHTAVKETLLGTEAEDITLLTADETFEGARITERWSNKKGSHYALAVLDPKVAATIYARKRGQVLKDLHLLEALFKSEQGLLRGLSLLNRIQALAQEAESYAGKLAVLGYPIGVTDQSFSARKPPLIEKIALRMEGVPKILASSIQPNYPIRNSAPLSLRGQLGQETKDTGYGLWVTSLTLTLRLFEGETLHRVFSYGAKGAGASPKESQIQSENALKEILFQNFSHDFQTYLENL